METGTTVRKVRGGYYWSPRTFEVRLVPPPGGELPETGGRWARVPGWLLVSLAPVMGAAFVVAFPVIGAGLLAAAAIRHAARRAARAAVEAAATVRPGWRAGEAHLGGTTPGDQPGAATPELDDLEKQIQERQRASESHEPGKP